MELIPNSSQNVLVLYVTPIEFHKGFSRRALQHRSENQSHGSLVSNAIGSKSLTTAIVPKTEGTTSPLRSSPSGSTQGLNESAIRRNG
ncbi:hypothetical protein CDAR_207461 [Caerostris darwini]|uniref:Uncharacterized protein n=1 Tax=Caerostris darwini TaxID=1538125 RepID=A0AAV4VGL2_9ARAC|nr:hypothetical protein CDAR_207461 [Caerostris darwini]